MNCKIFMIFEPRWKGWPPVLLCRILTEETLVVLEQLIEEIDQHMGEIIELVRLNFEFHTTLYQAANRTHLCELIATLRHRTEHYLHAYIIDMGAMPYASGRTPSHCCCLSSR